MQFTAEMIAGLISGEVVGDKNAAVHTVSSIEDGKQGGLAYLSNPKYLFFFILLAVPRRLWSLSPTTKGHIQATAVSTDS